LKTTFLKDLIKTPNLYADGFSELKKDPVFMKVKRL
jgi:hypothetical protein